MFSEHLAAVNSVLKYVPQNSTSFPNENEKHIDYVIVYKDNEKNKNVVYKEAVRNEFFQKLLEENVQIKFLEFKTENENHVYALLHCPNERLMVEAEKTKLPMRIDEVNLKNYFF